MKVKHVNLEANTSTHVKLPCKTGEILVKNFTGGDLLVCIEKEDFSENYVKIPAMTAEKLNYSEGYSTSKYHFFDDLYLKSVGGGEVEIRCIKI